MTRRAQIAPILRYGGSPHRTDQDLVAVESPLEVVLSQNGRTESLGVLMRTPGDDRDLILGLLLSEQIIRVPADVEAIDDQPADSRDEPARAAVKLAASADLSPVAGRTLTGTSACGLCGRLAMQALDRGVPLTPDAPKISAALIATLPGALRSQQAVFAETGGLHAAGLFDAAGAPHVIREDIGRHNAVDKVIGAALATGKVPARDLLLVVSGRVAYEIVQKAAAAGVPFVVAVGAPSSLAVEAARATGITLVGFVRNGRFNVYSGADRVEP